MHRWDSVCTIATMYSYNSICQNIEKQTERKTTKINLNTRKNSVLFHWKLHLIEERELNVH